MKQVWLRSGLASMELMHVSTCRQSYNQLWCVCVCVKQSSFVENQHCAVITAINNLKQHSSLEASPTRHSSFYCFVDYTARSCAESWHVSCSGSHRANCDICISFYSYETWNVGDLDSAAWFCNACFFTPCFVTWTPIRSSEFSF